MSLEEILRLAMQKGATDVHLKAGVMPVIRKHGVLRPLQADLQPLSPDAIEKMALGLMNPKQRQQFEVQQDVDIGYGISGLGRFRISAFKQRGTAQIVIRNIPFKVPTLAELTLPAIIEKLGYTERGLILVTGIAGSGKSSTIAALIDNINRREHKHILTIEDPIEFLIRDRRSLVTQREIGVDANNFAQALRAGLRQDPDVIFIGEMRDKETIETALMAAETGHLVVSTMHTLDATESINRILAAFDGTQQNQIRMQFAAILKAVISQRLARTKDGNGLVPACEILINTQRVRELIEDPAKTIEIPQAIEEGQSSYGMQSFDQSLMELLHKGMISYEEALLHCARPEDFRIRYEGITALDGKKWGSTPSTDHKQAQKWREIDEVEVIIPSQITNVKKMQDDETPVDKKAPLRKPAK